MKDLISHISTKSFAQAVGVESQTVRRALCMQGHYLGIKPVKIPNGRLLWPVKEIEKVLGVLS